ncbi:MAG: hypothetical protein KVP17_001659 [Porospora cf. gigantea B]|uniref:uncharacterized protein n=1 Tax=Porospora cf. gigantea B TaxID=2853592 RepID=UPI003571DB81|nr:MAG: hypothetical protein KVP17_001659 [Porospora cf. gigantea B]
MALSQHALEALRDHKYVAGTYTTLDRILLSYWWRPLSLCLPDFISPNALTLSGFGFSLAAFGVCACLCPTATEDVHPAACLLVAALLLAYQTADALDGLQARRLKLGTPLGQLLDHGCDAYSTQVFAFVGVAVAGRGDCDWFSLAIFTVMNLQLGVFNWWEQQFKTFPTCTGELGVTEGQAVVIGLWVIKAICPWVFTAELVPGLLLNTPIVTVIIGLLLFVLFGSVFKGFQELPTAHLRRALRDIGLVIAHTVLVGVLWFGFRSAPFWLRATLVMVLNGAFGYRFTLGNISHQHRAPFDVGLVPVYFLGTSAWVGIGQRFLFLVRDWTS